MNHELLPGEGKRAVFELLAAGEYSAAADAIERQLPDAADFAGTMNAYANVLMISDQFDRLIDAIDTWSARLLKDRSTACLRAAILRVLDQSDRAQAFSASLERLGGNSGELLSATAQAARISGKPDLQMDALFERAALPDVDRTSGLLKYVRTCFQYMDIDRAEAARSLIDPIRGQGQLVLALLDAAANDQKAVLDRVQSWLTNPDADARWISSIECLWTEAGIPELIEPMRAASVLWRDQVNVTAAGLLYHFLGLKGLAPAGRPIVENLSIEPGNHLDMAEALIEHGDISSAADIISQTASLATDLDRPRRQALSQIIDRLKQQNVRRALVSDQPDSDWLLSPPAEPGKLCIVFTGLNGRPGGVGSVQTLDRFLASYGYQALYVRDFNRLAYAKGIVSRGATQSDALSAIAGLIEEVGAQDPVFFGASLGSVGAVEFGLKLKARRILSFGYHNRKKNKDRWRVGDARAPLLCFREETFANGNIATLEDHLDNADHEFQIELFYEQSNLVDAFYARSHQHLSQLNFHPLANTMSHNCLRSMMADGSLARFF